MTEFILLRHKKHAFTLAEVLITLGIIGIVAALTIPNLMTNTKKKQYVARFKKTISTLSNAARMSFELYGYDFAGVNANCSANGGEDNPESRQSICALFNGTLKGATYYKGISKLGGKYSFNSESIEDMDSVGNYLTRIPVYSFSDGTLLLISYYIAAYNSQPCTKIIGQDPAHGANGYGNGCYGFLDVNGISPPNKETVCSKGTNENLVENAGDCIVNPNDINDIFPIMFYDGTVVPASRAGWYVFNNF